MFPPLAITQCVNLRKPGTLKVTANFKYHGRDATTCGHVLTKTQLTKSPLSSPPPTAMVSTAQGCASHKPGWDPWCSPPHPQETP